MLGRFNLSKSAGPWTHAKGLDINETDTVALSAACLERDDTIALGKGIQNHESISMGLLLVLLATMAPVRPAQLRHSDSQTSSQPGTQAFRSASPGRAQGTRRKALDSDIGARLASAVTRTESDRLTVYASNNGAWAPYNANTFVQWLNGVGYIQNSQTPRRYVHFLPQLLGNLPQELGYFANGGDPGDKGVRYKNELEKYTSRG
ncbi:hypothetical protein BBP40_010925 [Aspergillus hancockii]|nr:hypothetical protein BBP40_010925 [Aspergillus hancockii]